MWQLKIHPFITHYFTNLFILLEFFLIILQSLSFVPFVNAFRTILWANLGYLVILFPIIVLTMYYEVMIIKNNNEFYSAIKNNTIAKILLICLLVIQITAEVVFFQIGIVEIIGDQFPKAIRDPTTYQQWIEIGYIGAYMIIPFLNYRSLSWFKNWLGVKTELDHNRFKIDIIPVAPYMCISFIISLIAVTVYNYWFGFLK